MAETYTKTAIALQGGGALGAYAFGALKRIYESEANFRPSAISGVSIGAFTAAILEGIGQGKADFDIGGQKDGTITAEELLAYLRARVPQLTGNLQTPTCPLLRDFGEASPIARMK